MRQRTWHSLKDQELWLGNTPNFGIGSESANSYLLVLFRSQKDKKSIVGATREKTPHLFLFRIELRGTHCIFQAAVMTGAPSKLQASLGEGKFSVSQENKGQTSKLVAIMTKLGLRIQFIISLTLNTT